MTDNVLSLQERAAPQMQCFCCGPAHPTGLRIRSFWDESGEFVRMRHTPRPEFLGFPGLVYGFTQPIEMRISEMLTGTRGDVAIKLFGADLAQLGNVLSGTVQGATIRHFFCRLSSPFSSST